MKCKQVVHLCRLLFNVCPHLAKVASPRGAHFKNLNFSVQKWIPWCPLSLQWLHAKTLFDIAFWQSLISGGSGCRFSNFLSFTQQEWIQGGHTNVKMYRVLLGLDQKKIGIYITFSKNTVEIRHCMLGFTPAHTIK